MMQFTKGFLQAVSRTLPLSDLGDPHEIPDCSSSAADEPVSGPMSLEIRHFFFRISHILKVESGGKVASAIPWIGFYLLGLTVTTASPPDFPHSPACARCAPPGLITVITPPTAYDTLPSHKI